MNFEEVPYLKDPFFLEGISYEENFSFENGNSYFTIIAPTFGESNDMTAYTIPFMVYLSELAKVTKEKSGRNSEPIVLDLIKSYGRINEWPEETLYEEKRVKMGIIKEIDKELNLRLKFLELEEIEKTDEWKVIEEEVKKTINVPLTEGALQAGKDCSYEKNPSIGTLIKRTKQYDLKRWTEFTYMTKMNALTIKCSVPKIDDLYDVCLGREKVPRFYIPKMMKSRIFRPKEGEITFRTTEEKARKITNDFNPTCQETVFLSAIGFLISSKDVNETVKYNRKNKNPNEIEKNAKIASEFIASIGEKI